MDPCKAEGGKRRVLASRRLPPGSRSPSRPVPVLPRRSRAAPRWSLAGWCRLRQVFLQRRDVTSANRADKFAAVLYLRNLIAIDR